MIHALTIDVEDANNLFSRHRLGVDMGPTRRVVENTHRLLDLFSEHNTRATFFILGEVANAFPQLIRDIAAGRHELGVHGYYHTEVFKLTADGFRTEVHDAKARVEDIIGMKVQGHRAPAFSITPETPWAWEVLVEEGFTYDSSVFPFRGRRYGWPTSPIEPYQIQTASGRLLELPLSVVEVAGRRIPTAGGGYLRMFPLAWTRWTIRRIQKARPAVVYLHPYEYETEPRLVHYPPMPLRRGLRVRCYDWLRYRGRGTVWRKVQHLLDEFRFDTLRDVFLSKYPRPGGVILQGSADGKPV